ncbi:hypothetical protein CAL12_04385 [Bordetella genomosp. 8]|uniref:Uncharacterized protein n=1 Tax=Bordetella genomosp. 8 TaxID=1416806 RepID=A0A1W6YGJ6_9BORD|nr:hypothetical protein [Bordetella genomosp. 8]ARP80138.1 hypothetical protein CAL12_04385 [Bordetella genomosp. 8]
MTPERFQAIVQAYGADARRWPEAERAGAQAWASGHPVAADAILAAAAPLDAWLDGDTVSPPDRSLFDRIVASAPARPLWRRARLWWSGAVFAGVGVAGGCVGAFAVSFYMLTAVPAMHADAPWMETGFSSPLSDWSEE